MVNVFPYGVVANQAYGTWNIISAWAECNQIRYHLKVLDFDFNFTSCMCLSCEQFFTSEIWHGPVKCLHCSVMDCNCFSNNTDFFVVVNNQVFGLGVIRKYWYFFKETKTVICLQPPPPSPLWETNAYKWCMVLIFFLQLFRVRTCMWRFPRSMYLMQYCTTV